ncbi:hypothetical protein [Polynucleobacter brandtiae]|uniref:Uncharacterized protein n=1 Tax=Polynucleobacter brandtiae TaxID=1938816 RepID=A0A2M8VYZ8_9BURK|nr:hypothetical protein B0G85_0473 [Polynucleobacter brandtiae]
MGKVCIEKNARGIVNMVVDDVDTPRINLATSEDVRREMSKVYREARSSKIPTQEATRYIYILTQILKAHELVFLEKRLSELEYAHQKTLK